MNKLCPFDANLYLNIVNLLCLLIIGVVINLKWVQCQYVRFQSNQTEIRCIQGCPYSTECNDVTGYCECTSQYPIFINSSKFCLMRKYLGELCFHSMQCNHVENAICISNANIRNELKTITRKDYFKSIKMIKNPEKYLPRKDFGRCDCRPGYWANPKTHKCDLLRLDRITCNDSHQCPDQNSHCDIRLHKCVCDPRHYYHPLHDRCLLTNDIFGVFSMFCKTNMDCQVFDEQLICFLNTCTCINNNRYDPIRGCQARFQCKEGQNWNEFRKICENTYPYTNLFENRELKREWHKFTPKMLIFFMSVSIMIFMMKNRRSIFPSITHFNLDRNRNWNLFSGVSSFPPYDSRRMHYPDVGRRIRVPVSTLPNAHNVHLRVNMNDEENDQIVMPCNRRMSIGSNLSLPPYESVNGETDNQHRSDSPPPSYDELPSYEDAINYIEKETDINDNNKTSESVRDSLDSGSTSLQNPSKPS